MATTNDSVNRAGEKRARLLHGRPPGRYRWTIEQYYRLNRLGFFRNQRVELIEGEIYEMSPANPPHAISMERLARLLPTIFPAGYRIRFCAPLDLGRRTEPEPDAAILEGDPLVADEHPSTALLVIEVSDSSLRYDRTIKAHLYARAGIQDYWILNLVDRQLEIHRRPVPDPEKPGRFRYADITIVPADGHAAPLAKPEARIAVADLLP